MESIFGKIVSPHVCRLKRIPVNRFREYKFFLVHFTQASLQACSTKQFFLKISENRNLQENTCARDFFLKKLHTIKPATLYEIDFSADVSP